jgi:hypothetical protein
MSDLVAAQSPALPVSSSRAHSRWVRICHWIAAASFMALALSGFLILMVHPRLYLGHVGNDLTPALLTLPISNNYRRLRRYLLGACYRHDESRGLHQVDLQQGAWASL